MPRRMLAMVAALTALAPIAAAQRAPAAAERELYRLEDAFAQAVVRRDAAALRAIVAPRWVYSDESGVMTRDDGIRAFTTGADTVREAGNDRMRAIVYGTTAVVIGELWMRGRGPTGPFTHRYRYTDTWLAIDGKWRCIASQDWLMPEPPR